MSGAPTPPTRPRVVALLPAHDEGQGIAAAVRSVAAQADQVVVISDNSTDDTMTRAAEAGAVVVESVANRAKKAGALNQALDAMLGLRPSPLALPPLAEDDLVLVMDADGEIGSQFVAAALDELDDAEVGAVGGIFWGEPGGGILEQLQRNEFARYARDVSRRGARAWVLSGTACLFRVRVLREVAVARESGLLPGGRGVYDTLALTEDNELTLAIKSLGYAAMSPQSCTVTTEVMTTWRALWHQRLRWQRGALENLRHYGLSRVTLPYVVQQATMGVGLFAMWLFVGVTAISAVLAGVQVHPVWACVGLVFLAERVVTVRRAGWCGVALAAPMLVEWVYDLFLQAVIVASVVHIVRRRPAEWRHAAVARVV